MNRLTKDLHTPHDDTTYAEVVKDAIDRENIVLTKLKHYEDIEEELGIDLITLFKALQNGVWVEVNPIDIDFENPKTMYLEEFLTLEKRLDGTLCLDARDYVDELELKDYKKTWWLKEDKTE